MPSDYVTNLDVFKFIVTSNMPQMGSFGEYVFAEICRAGNVAIEPVHAERHDFRVDGQRRVDVKTSRRRLNIELSVPCLKIQHQIQGIEFAAVEFCISGVLVSLEGAVLGHRNWTDLNGLFCGWKSGKAGKVHGMRSVAKKGLPSELRTSIEVIFLRHGLPVPYILYRTIMFNDESPHNLLPSQRGAKDQCGWTVFLVFNTAPAALNNLSGIIAFPDVTADSLPRLNKIRASRHIEGLEKADLSLMPSTFKFKTLPELESFICAQSNRSTAG